MWIKEVFVRYFIFWGLTAIFNVNRMDAKTSNFLFIYWKSVDSYTNHACVSINVDDIFQWLFCGDVVLLSISDLSIFLSIQRKRERTEKCVYSYGTIEGGILLMRKPITISWTMPSFANCLFDGWRVWVNSELNSRLQIKVKLIFDSVYLVGYKSHKCGHHKSFFEIRANSTCWTHYKFRCQCKAGHLRGVHCVQAEWRCLQRIYCESRW